MTWIDYRSARPFTYSRQTVTAFPNSSIINLSLNESRAIGEAALNIPTNPYKLEEQESFISASRKIGNLFDPKTRNLILNQLNFGFGAVLIQGLPVDENLPNTPLTGGSLPVEYKKTFVSEAMLLALGTFTDAEPFNFRQEGLGKAPLIDNIVPVKNLKTQKGAGGFDNNFPFHCESAWHRKRPDYLILLGIREEPGAQTLVFSSTMLNHEKLLENMIKAKKWFRLKAPDLYVQMEKFGIPSGTPQYLISPPLQIRNSSIELNINFNGTDCLNETAIDWLFKLEKFIEAKTVGTVISPGNALILNNYKTCHTRTGYSPLFNGEDRWFLRGYFKKDLWSESQRSKIISNPSNDIKELIKLGWISNAGTLTKEFSNYVYNPEETKKLDTRMAELAAAAFHLTPIKGSRIV